MLPEYPARITNHKLSVEERAANKLVANSKRRVAAARIKAEAAARAVITDNLSTSEGVQATLDVIDMLAAHKAAIKARSIAAFKNKIPPP